MPRPRIKRKFERNIFTDKSLEDPPFLLGSELSEKKKRGSKRKSKVVDHTAHRTYVVTQQIHMSERYGYVEEEIILFGKDEDMTVLHSNYGSFLRTKNFISVPKGRGRNITKIFNNMKEFKDYLKEIDGIIL